MRPFALAAAALLAACGSDDTQVTPDAAVSAACEQAKTYQDLPTIETEIFAKHCNFSGCHKTSSTQSPLKLEPGISHANLVNVASDEDPSRMLVVPNQPNQSWLLYMVQRIAPADMSPPAPDVPPGDEGFMPGRTAEPLCQEKLDAIHRWIEAGAPAT